MIKKVASVLVSLALMTGILAGCSASQATTTAAAAETTKAAAAEASAETSASTAKTYGVTYWCESDFFGTIAESITELAKADGATTIVVDAQQDPDLQLRIVEDFIAKGVDAVFLQPVDKDAIKPALLKLKEAGIPVINFDSAVSDLDLVDAYVATNNYEAGVQCGEAMLKDFPNGGKIAVLDYPANNACVERTNGFMDTIKGKGFEVVAQFDAQGNNEKGLTITNDILQAHSDLVAIFGINDQCGMGAYAAITAAGEKIKIYGVDGAFEAKKAIAEKGLYAMTAAQSPITIGKECYKVAQGVLAGQKADPFTIEVEPFVIDGANADQYLNAPWQ